MCDMVRCPSCRGSKKVAKLGGVIGECNTCLGEGKIKAIDKVQPVEVVQPDNVVSVVEAVANALPVSNESNVIEAVKDVKVDGKKALYKRKKA